MTEEVRPYKEREEDKEMMLSVFVNKTSESAPTLMSYSLLF